VGEIVQIGEGRFEQVWQKRCPHKHQMYDLSERTVQCRDCKRVVDGFEAFMIAVRYWRDAEAGLNYRREEITELEKRAELGLLRVTKTVDHAWRSKKMVLVCPHCDEAIFPEDGLGTSSVNKQMAIEKRKFKKEI
jgi:hypothetical protein